MDEIEDRKKIFTNFDCFCSSAHCEGNLYICADRMDGEKVFMVTVVDTSGDDEGTMWLSIDQMKKLIEDLNKLVKEWE